MVKSEKIEKFKLHVASVLAAQTFNAINFSPGINLSSVTCANGLICHLLRAQMAQFVIYYYANG